MSSYFREESSRTEMMDKIGEKRVGGVFRWGKRKTLKKKTWQTETNCFPAFYLLPFILHLPALVTSYYREKSFLQNTNNFKKLPHSLYEFSLNATEMVR